MINITKAEFPTELVLSSDCEDHPKLLICSATFLAIPLERLLTLELERARANLTDQDSFSVRSISFAHWTRRVKIINAIMADLDSMIMFDDFEDIEGVVLKSEVL